MDEEKMICVDCGNRVQVDRRFYAMFWIAPHPEVTLDHELEFNEDFGPYCTVCFNHRKRHQREPNSEIEKNKM